MNLSIKNVGNKTFESNAAIGVFGPAGDILKTTGEVKTGDTVIEPGHVGQVTFLSGEGTQRMLLNCTSGGPMFSVFLMEKEGGNSKVCAMATGPLPDFKDMVPGDEVVLFLPTVYPTGKISVNI